MIETRGNRSTCGGPSPKNPVIDQKPVRAGLIRGLTLVAVPFLVAFEVTPDTVGNSVVDKLSHTVNALGSISVGGQDIVTQPSCQPDAVKLDDDGQQ